MVLSEEKLVTRSITPNGLKWLTEGQCQKFFSKRLSESAATFTFSLVFPVIWEAVQHLLISVPHRNRLALPPNANRIPVQESIVLECRELGMLNAMMACYEIFMWNLEILYILETCLNSQSSRKKDY